MNVRQIAVLNLARFNKLVKQLTYNVCILGDASLKEFAMELMDYEEWVASVRDYAMTSQSPRFMEEIAKLGKPKLLEDYVFESQGNIPDSQHQILSKIIDYLNDFAAIYKDYDKDVKGEFSPLVSVLATKEAVALLDRSVKAGYLDATYQPRPMTTLISLKFIAYGVMKALDLQARQTWTTFEEQWHLEEGIRLSNQVVSDVQFEAAKPIMAIYPEVDFMPLITPKDLYLSDKYGLSKIKNLFYELRRGGYIAKDTKIDEFLSNFQLGKLKERVPINWVKEQKYLVYFAFLAFNNSNKELWKHVKACFVVNGKMVNDGSMKSCIGKLRKEENFVLIEPKLRRIASDYVNG